MLPRRLLLAAVATFAGLAAAQAQNPITIGFGMALTGGLAPNGKAALLAMQIWGADINAKGGLLGRPVKLVYYDDQCEVCQAGVSWLRFLDRRHPMHPIALSSARLPPGLLLEDCLRELHVVAPTQTLVGWDALPSLAWHDCLAGPGSSA